MSHQLPELDLPPGPQTRNPLGFLFAVQASPLDFLLTAAKRYGGFLRFRAGLWSVFLVAQPDAVRHILRSAPRRYSKNTFTYNTVKSIGGPGLLTLDGDAWQTRRKLMQPVFARDRVASFDTTVTNITCLHLARWALQAQQSQPIDVAIEMRQLTLAIAAKAFFAIDIAQDDNIGDAVDTLSELFTKRFRSAPAAILGFLRVPTHDQVRLRQSQEHIASVARAIIMHLRQSTSPQETFLAQLAQTTHEGGGQALNDQELVTEVMTLLIAGHETTARALTWCLYVLGRHPEWLDRMQRETRQVLAGRLPMATDLEHLPTTRMVLDETLRLFPPIWAFSRRAEEDDIVCGYRVPKGARILVSPYVLHRLPEYWPNPNVFSPERFSTGNVPEYTYIPFGGGPRQCIGKRFALLEAQLILATIAQRFTLELAEGSIISPTATATLSPDRPVVMKLRPIVP